MHRMKPDIYTKSLLTIAVALLSVIAARTPMTSANYVVHAASPAVAYRYGSIYEPIESVDPMKGLNDLESKLADYSLQGWEVVDIIPVAGRRVDNIATGTTAVLVECRRAK